MPALGNSVAIFYFLNKEVSIIIIITAGASHYIVGSENHFFDIIRRVRVWGYVRRGDTGNTKGLGSFKLVRERVENKGIIHDS